MSIQEKLIGALGALVLLAFAAIGIHAHGVDQGEKLERVVWQGKELKRDAAERKLILKHETDMAELQRRYNENNLKVSDDHEKELAQVRADAAADRAAVERRGGLRIPRTVCDRVAADAEAAGARVSDEIAAASVRLPRATEERLWALADAADEVTAQARACQAWIRVNGFYGNPVNSDSVLLDRMVDAENPTPKESHD